MCFDASTSKRTYIAGMLGCLALAAMGHAPEAWFYAVVVQMQLVEFLLHKHGACDDFNRTITKAGIAVNHSEPIALWLAIRRDLPPSVTYLMALYVLAASLVTAMAFSRNECTSVTPESHPHLHWKWNYASYAGPFYALFLLALVALSVHGLPNGQVHAAVVAFSFAASLAVYGRKHAVGAL